MSRLARSTLIVAVFFGLEKLLGFARQALVARTFGLSPELDAFNAANNLPDLIFALISGGALAVAFIPVLSQYLEERGRPAAWDLFSRIANPISVLLPLGIVWAYYGHWLSREISSVSDESRRAGLNRLYYYILSLAGLVTAFTGTALVVTFILDTLVGRQLWGADLRLRISAALAAGPGGEVVAAEVHDGPEPAVIHLRIEVDVARPDAEPELARPVEPEPGFETGSGQDPAHAKVEVHPVSVRRSLFRDALRSRRDGARGS